MKNRRRLVWTLVLTLAATVGMLVWVIWAGFTPRLGLDLAGGTSVVLTAPANTKPEALNKAAEIIRSRVDGLGVGEPEIVVEGKNIVVQLPGLKDRDRALDIVGRTAELTFRPVLEVIPAAYASYPEKSQYVTTTTTKPSGKKKTTTTTKPAETTTTKASLGRNPDDVWHSASVRRAQAPADPGAPAGGSGPGPGGPINITTNGAGGVDAAPTQGGAAPQQIPVTLTPPDEIKDDATITVPDRNGNVYKLGPTAVKGTEVRGANAQIPPGGIGGWQVQLEFSQQGAQQYADVTGKAACNPENDPKRQIAIVLDGVVQSAPQVNADVQCNVGINGGGVITLGASDDAAKQQKEAQDLALVLRYGSLPVKLTQANVTTVSATLGQDSLVAGLIGAAIGFLVIGCLILIVYRLYGVLVVFRLGVFAVMTYIVVCLLGQFRGLALTLSGLAAIAVSIGINADSAIVAVERVKDEIRDGRSMRTSWERGFTKSWRTIVSADIVSLIASVVLYFLAVGSVRGFALMLGISTLLDLFVSWCVTRPAAILLSNTTAFRTPKLVFWRHEGPTLEALT